MQAENTPKTVSLQVLDIATILKDVRNEKGEEPQMVTNMNKFHKAGILDNIADFVSTRDKIYELLKSEKKGKQKIATMNTVQHKYIGYIHTFLEKNANDRL